MKLARSPIPHGDSSRRIATEGVCQSEGTQKGSGDEREGFLCSDDLTAGYNGYSQEGTGSDVCKREVSSWEIQL